MKTFKHWLVIPATLAMLLTSAGVVRSDTIQVAPGFQPDPLVVTGTSGGTQDSKGCGMIGATPNHVINLGNDFEYLRFSVQSTGQPTLLIKGPNGTTCIPGVAGENIQDSGLWGKGSYSIYIGDRAGGQNPYTLSITQKR